MDDDASQEIRVLNYLLAERERVLDAIPPCPSHGSSCVPHALDWVNRKVAESTPVTTVEVF